MFKTLGKMRKAKKIISGKAEKVPNKRTGKTTQKKPTHNITIKIKRKSQVSFEFMLLLSVLLTVFLLFFVFIAREHKDIYSEKRYNTIKDVAYSVQTELNSALFVKDGYKREIYLPEQIEGINYSIRIYNHNVLVVTSNEEEFSLTIPEVNGSISKGRNKITKENNTIYISPA